MAPCGWGGGGRGRFFLQEGKRICLVGLSKELVEAKIFVTKADVRENKFLIEVI